MQRSLRRFGFTLIELLVSVTMIAVLTVIGVVSYSSVNKRSRDVKRRSDLEQIRSALEMYRSDYGYYPSVGAPDWTSADSLDTHVSFPQLGLVSVYMPAIPEDPQRESRSYTYYYIATSQSGDDYYGYCVCTNLETAPSAIGTCAVALPGNGNCNYGLKNP